jgi:tetratricopeptide (TPR) repeat protein
VEEDAGFAIVGKEILFRIPTSFAPRFAGDVGQMANGNRFPVVIHSRIEQAYNDRRQETRCHQGEDHSMETISFKFKWIDDEGNEQGFFAKKGSFDGETLQLDDTAIPVVAIVEAEFRDRFMFVSVMTDEQEPALLGFSIVSGSAQRLKEEMGRARSSAWARLHREDLEKQGLSHTYREVQCPHCQAIIDLTNMERTPQISCEFCNTVSTIDTTSRPDDSMGPLAAEKQYRICDECGMYSKPRKFTIFYFYFLLVVYGVYSAPTWRCPACMRGEAWKMLFGNLLFLVGLPVALVQLFRSYGGTDIGGLYPGLDRANLKARGGDFEGAIADYRAILEKQPVSAGVKYNIGLAFLHDKDEEGAARMFEYALKDCANYQPAAVMLAQCYESLGETEKLAALKIQWGVTDEEVSEKPSNPDASST